MLSLVMLASGCWTWQEPRISSYDFVAVRCWAPLEPRDLASRGHDSRGWSLWTPEMTPGLGSGHAEMLLKRALPRPYPRGGAKPLLRQEGLSFFIGVETVPCGGAAVP